MSEWYQDVYDFHEKFGCHIENKPKVATEQIRELRWNLIEEEYGELESAITTENLPQIADAIVDSIYVLIGTAISYGIDLRPIWDAVHVSNMNKVGGGERSDGKILKPGDWVAPDVESLIKEQQRRSE